MRKRLSIILICVIFMQCIFFAGCNSPMASEEITLPVVETETKAKTTEEIVESEIVEGDFLDQYTISPNASIEEIEETDEKTTEKNEDTRVETYLSPESTEDEAEKHGAGFIPGENETPGDPL